MLPAIYVHLCDILSINVATDLKIILCGLLKRVGHIYKIVEKWFLDAFFTGQNLFVNETVFGIYKMPKDIVLAVTKLCYERPILRYFGWRPLDWRVVAFLFSWWRKRKVAFTRIHGSSVNSAKELYQPTR